MKKRNKQILLLVSIVLFQIFALFYLKEFSTLFFLKIILFEADYHSLFSSDFGQAFLLVFGPMIIIYALIHFFIIYIFIKTTIALFFGKTYEQLR